LSEKKIREAVLAFGRLEGTGYSLGDAVDFLLEHRAGEGGSVTVRELFDAYLQDRIDAHRSPKTITDIRHRLGRFAADYEDALVHEITKKTLADWMRKQNGGPVSKGNIRRHLSGLFNFGMKRDNLRSNPAAALTTPTVRKDRRPPVLTVSATRRLMNTAAEHEPAMVPHFVLCLFCGIRPSEVERLDWSAIDWERKEVFVGAKVSKSGNERYTTLQPNALEWLLPYRQDTGHVHYSRREYRAVREKSKVEWGHDVLRHSFGSMHLSAFRNAGDTAEQMGHGSSTQTLFKHYRRAVREADAVKFWEIRPIERRTAIRIAS
jgi:integrase